jgi:hypothetical protein
MLRTAADVFYPACLGHLLQLEHWNQQAACGQARPMQLQLPVPAGQVELGVLLVKGELMLARLPSAMCTDW